MKKVKAKEVKARVEKGQAVFLNNCYQGNWDMFIRSLPKGREHLAGTIVRLARELNLQATISDRYGGSVTVSPIGAKVYTPNICFHNDRPTLVINRPIHGLSYSLPDLSKLQSAPASKAGKPQYYWEDSKVLLLTDEGRFLRLSFALSSQDKALEMLLTLFKRE